MMKKKLFWPLFMMDSWIKRINEGYTVIFEDMYQKDIAARQVSEGSVNAEQTVFEGIAGGEEAAEQKKMLEDVMKKMKSLGNQFERVMSIVEKFEERLVSVESFVKEAQKGSEKK